MTVFQWTSEQAVTAMSVILGLIGEWKYSASTSNVISGFHIILWNLLYVFFDLRKRWVFALTVVGPFRQKR